MGRARTWALVIGWVSLGLSLAMPGCSASGCSSSSSTSCSSCTSCTPIDIFGDAGLQRDAFVPHDVGHDGSRDADQRDAPTCNMAGSVGAHCPTRHCASGAFCFAYTGEPTVQGAFGIRQAGAPDPAHAGYRLALDPAEPADAAPFNAFVGGLCGQQCDTSMGGQCGACASCSDTLTQLPIIAMFGGVRADLPVTTRMFGDTTGLCRLDCTWSPTTPSAECPDSMACATGESVCIDACTSDVECNTGSTVTYDGELLTTIETAHPRACNTVTGRCESLGRTTARVGDSCAGDDECAPVIGTCVPGGHCGEYECDPSTSSACGGGGGICLPSTGSRRSQPICVVGCSTASDCGGGNVCVTLPTGFAFAGFCSGTCGDDGACIPSEACTDSETTDASGATVILPGRCVPRCTGLGAVGVASGGCADTEFCLADHDGASYGRCEPADRFCGAPNTASLPAASSGCATGWVCDELLSGVMGRSDASGDGHCTPACTGDSDCTRGSCVTSGRLAGLCRTACTRNQDCTSPTVCDVSLGWCVEVGPPSL